VSDSITKAGATIGLRIARDMFDVYEARQPLDLVVVDGERQGVEVLTLNRIELAAMIALGVEAGMRKVLRLDEDPTSGLSERGKLIYRKFVANTRALARGSR
jgi:hypothetical protein